MDVTFCFMLKTPGINKDGAWRGWCMANKGDRSP